MLGKTNNATDIYENKYALQFRRGWKDEKPYFNVRQYHPEKINHETITKVSGIFKGILFNPSKDVITKEWKAVTIQPWFTVVLADNSEAVYYVAVDYWCGAQMRAMLNSLLTANIGDDVELSTYISKGKYKVISVTNPKLTKEITFEKDGKSKTVTVNEWYTWAFTKEQIPEIEVVKDWEEILKVKDEKANEFFKAEVEKKFATKTDNNSTAISMDEIPF